MDTVTYSPAEFAAIFGKERTWAYRQLYAGKVQAVTGLGRTLIPKSEVDRLLKEAGRYLGAQAKVKKTPHAVSGPELPKSVKCASEWAAAISHRKRKPAIGAAGSSAVSNSTNPKPTETAKGVNARHAAFQRLTGRKNSKLPNPPGGGKGRQV